MNEIILFFFAWAFSNHFPSHLKFFRVFFLLLLYQGQRNGLILILGSWTLSLLVITALSYLICLLIYWMGFNKSTKPFKNRLLPVPYIYLCITCYSAPPLSHCARVTSILNFVFIVPLLFFVSLLPHIDVHWLWNTIKSISYCIYSSRNFFVYWALHYEESANFCFSLEF